MTSSDPRPSEADLLTLSADLPEARVEVGQTVIEQGDPPGPLYVLVDGRVNIERDGHAFATVDHPGAVFGEMAIVMGRSATATVRATESATLRVAHDGSDFLDRAEVARAVLALTATRLDTMTQYLSDVRAQFGHLDNHLGMVDGVLEALLHHQAPTPRPGSARDPYG